MEIALPQHADELFRCPVHECTLRGRICVWRQLFSLRQVKGRRTTRACERHADPDRPRELARHDGKRGLGLDFPLCRTDRCALGRAILRALGPECAQGVRSGDRQDCAQGRAAIDAEARARLYYEEPRL